MEREFRRLYIFKNKPTKPAATNKQEESVEEKEKAKEHKDSNNNIDNSIGNNANNIVKKDETNKSKNDGSIVLPDKKKDLSDSENVAKSKPKADEKPEQESNKQEEDKKDSKTATTTAKKLQKDKEVVNHLREVVDAAGNSLPVDLRSKLKKVPNKNDNKNKSEVANKSDVNMDNVNSLKSRLKTLKKSNSLVEDRTAADNGSPKAEEVSNENKLKVVLKPVIKNKDEKDSGVIKRTNLNGKTSNKDKRKSLTPGSGGKLIDVDDLRDPLAFQKMVSEVSEAIQEEKKKVAKTKKGGGLKSKRKSLLLKDQEQNEDDIKKDDAIEQDDKKAVDNDKEPCDPEGVPANENEKEEKKDDAVVVNQDHLETTKAASNDRDGARSPLSRPITPRRRMPR